MKAYRHKDTGAFLGFYNVAPVDGIETVSLPAHGSQIWDGDKWIGAIPAPGKRDVEKLVDALETEGILTPAKATAIKQRL